MEKSCWSITAVVVCLFITCSAKALNLPPSPVTVTIQNSSEGFFGFALSGVPSGYDVRNRNYPAWCVTLFLADPTTGGGVHDALLYETLGGAAPAPFTSLPWDKIHYVLNHKQGSPTDVQYAIWHFTDGFNPDAVANPAAVAMIADADANGAGFVPQAGDIVAVAVAWQGNASSLQACITEVRLPGSGAGPGTGNPPGGNPPGGQTNDCPDRFTAGGFIYVNGSKANFGIQGGYQNGRLWGGINYVDHSSGMHIRSRTITSYTVVDANCRLATYDVTVDGEQGTASVLVCDNGEPGRNDILEITLSNGYTAGTGATLGGGNVQLHRSKCGSDGRGGRGNNGSNNRGNGHQDDGDVRGDDHRGNGNGNHDNNRGGGNHGNRKGPKLKRAHR